MSLNTILATTPNTSTNYILKATGTSIGNSLIYDNGTNVAIGGTTMSSIFNLNGTDPLISFQNAGSTKWQVGLENTASNRFIWYDNTAAAYRMVITSSGNVGIGTSSPNTLLQVSKTTNVPSLGTAAGGFSIRREDGNVGMFMGYADSGNSWIQVQRTDSATAYNLLLQPVGGNVGIGTSSPSKLFTVLNSSEGQTAGISGPTYGIRFDNGGAFAFGASAIHGVDTTLTGSYQSLAINGSQLLFGTDGGEKMRLTNGGNFLIGQTTASASTNGMYLRPGVDSGMVATNDSALSLVRLSSNGKILRFFFGASEVGSISTNTNSLPSDLNFKKDITNISIGLNLINKLRPVHYRYNLDEDNEPLSNGIIAQELEKALLECGIEKNSLLMLQHKPIEDKNQSEYWVDYTKMIPVLVKAIQEQQAMIEAQQQQINQLINK